MQDFNQNTTTQLERTVSDARDALNDKLEINSVPESVFVDYFLPYFNGTKPMDKDSVIVAKWADIAGNMHMPVNLTNDNNEVVDTVPPILSEFVPTKGVDMNAVITKYDLGTKVAPEKSEIYLHNQLGKLGGVNDNRWDRIINKYTLDTDTSNTTDDYDDLDDFID